MQVTPMAHTNVEFKARLRDEARVRAVLKKLRARPVGTDHQVDTYFRVPSGRLKLREGRIENALIFYRRSNARRLRPSRIELALLPRRNALKAVLGRALGVLATVEKRREIYFVGSVKIHLDRVRGLGKFVEVEAIQKTPRGNRRRTKLNLRKTWERAVQFRRLFGITSRDHVGESYSDMVPSGGA